MELKPSFKHLGYHLVVLVLLITNILALLFANGGIRQAHQHKASKNPYPLIDPARELVNQKNYLINIQALRDRINSIVNDYGSDKISVYYEQLNSGANISINKDLRLWPASLTKLPVAMAVAKKVEMGDWQWDTKLTLEQKDVDSHSGDLYKQPIGTIFTVDELETQILVNSDNTAENILSKNLTDNDYQRLIEEIGLQDLFDDQGKVSAKEYARLYRSLYTSSFLERDNSQKILTLLVDANFHDFLSQGLPTDVKFAHKFGENESTAVLADGGIVYYDSRPYMIIVIMQLKDTSDASLQQGKDIMKQISTEALNDDKI